MYHCNTWKFIRKIKKNQASIYMEIEIQDKIWFILEHNLFILI